MELKIFFVLIFAIIIFIAMLISAWDSVQRELDMEEKIREHEQAVEAQEAENRELINKALKHYAETKGIK
jgi:cell division protein FtsL